MRHPPRSGTTYPTLLWRLLQPGQGYHRSCARRILPRSTGPPCRRRLGVCPRNTSHLGPLIKEDLRSRPSLVLVRHPVEDRLRHYSAPDCGPHSAPSPQRALPGPRSLRIPRAARLGRTLPAMTSLSIREFRCLSRSPLLNPWISQPPRLPFPSCPLDRMSYRFRSITLRRIRWPCSSSRNGRASSSDC